MNQQLLTQIRRGDTAAFAQAVQQLQYPLFNYLGRMGLDQAIAEDIAQETFVRAWQARERFDAKQSAYSTWVFTIARRLALNELERAWRQRERTEANTEQYPEQSGGTICTPDDIPEHLATPLAHLQRQDLQQQLESALAALPSHERSMLALAYISGLGLADIAQIEEIPTGTVKSRLHRIRGKLKTLIGNPQA